MSKQRKSQKNKKYANSNLSMKVINTHSDYDITIEISSNKNELNVAEQSKAMMNNTIIFDDCIESNDKNDSLVSKIQSEKPLSMMNITFSEETVETRSNHVSKNIVNYNKCNRKIIDIIDKLYNIPTDEKSSISIPERTTKFKDILKLFNSGSWSIFPENE